MGELINLQDYRKKKGRKTDSPVVQTIRDSLNNESVMQRYNIKTPTLEERTENIKKSIARINALMSELNDTNTGKGLK